MQNNVLGFHPDAGTLRPKLDTLVLSIALYVTVSCCERYIDANITSICTHADKHTDGRTDGCTNINQTDGRIDSKRQAGGWAARPAGRQDRQDRQTHKRTCLGKRCEP